MIKSYLPEMSVDIIANRLRSEVLQLSTDNETDIVNHATVQLTSAALPESVTRLQIFVNRACRWICRVLGRCCR